MLGCTCNVPYVWRSAAAKSWIWCCHHWWSDASLRGCESLIMSLREKYEFSLRLVGYPYSRRRSSSLLAIQCSYHPQSSRLAKIKKTGKRRNWISFPSLPLRHWILRKICQNHHHLTLRIVLESQTKRRWKQRRIHLWQKHLSCYLLVLWRPHCLIALSRCMVQASRRCLTSNIGTSPLVSFEMEHWYRLMKHARWYMRVPI